MNFPLRNEYSDYFNTYVSHLPVANPIELLEKTQAFTLEILKQVPPELYDYQYAEGKWTIKGILVHLLDCEQIMNYRALRFARNDFASALPFEENDYVAAVDTSALDWNTLVASTKLQRAHTINLFKSFTEEVSKRGGSAAFPNTVRAIAAINAGHQLHHIYVLQERYLNISVQKFEL